MAPIQTVGVIGTGQLDNGIAQVFATAGLAVALNDISEGALHGAISKVEFKGTIEPRRNGLCS